MEDSFSIIISDAVITSTPTATPRKTPGGPRSSITRVRVARPLRKNPISGICHICGKDYVRKKSFDDHIRLHALVDANSRYPDAARLTAETPTIAKNTLQRMSAVPSVGAWGPEHNEFLKGVLTSLHLSADWLQFCSKLADKFISAIIMGKFLLPSTLLPIICKVSESILSCKELRMELLSHLQNMNQEHSPAMLNCFICQFVLEFGEDIVTFICKCVAGEKPKKIRECKDFDIEDRQCIFYVAGSVMRVFLRMGYRHKTNKDWCAIVNTIHTRIEGQGVDRASESDRAWTEERNRKSLVFIGALAMEFFVSLTHILYNIESDAYNNFTDENAIKDVYEDSMTIILWDELIGSSLSSGLAIRFHRGVVRSYTQTYGKGVAYKKLNNSLRKAFAAITLRHSVAPRQST